MFSKHAFHSGVRATDFSWPKNILVFALSLSFAFIATLGFACSVHAAELNDVKMADSTTVDGKTLNLNGLGLRKVTKFGIPVKVYVGALYVEKKTKDSAALVKSDEVKKLILHFVRNVDRDVLADGFRASYDDGCFTECDKKGDQFALLKPHIVSVRQDNEIAFTFYKDKIEIDTNGPNAKKQIINDANLSRNMLSLFINEKKPPTEDLRKGLLGL